jgi:sec-independent protein translocase protein TatC
LERHEKIIRFLVELRRSILLIGSALLLCTASLYFISPVIMYGLQTHLSQKLAFYTVAEPFLAHLQLSFSVAVFSLMPGILYCVWKAAVKPFDFEESSLAWFVLFTSLLFYSGTLFCYFITLPFGVKFLLGFQSEQLQPVISIAKFVTFVTIFILAFGVIFELPVFMVFSAKAGLFPRRRFEQHRRYAILAISIIAALLTPTPDIVNMLLMGLPLYILYELGIIILRIMRVE